MTSPHNPAASEPSDQAQNVEADTGADTAPEKDLPPIPDDVLILVPMRGTVLFPGTVLPVTVGRPRSIAAAQAAMQAERPLGLILQRHSESEEPAPEDLHEVGTIVDLLRYITAPDGTHHVICQGEQRFRIVEFLDGYPFYAARVQKIEEKESSGAEVEARLHHVREKAVEALQLIPDAPPELSHTVQTLTDGGVLADLIASYMDLTPEEKQEVLETFDVQRRLDRVLDLLTYRIEVLRLSKEIGEQTKKSIDERQRQALLREQLHTIQRELGEEDARTAEIAALQEAITQAKMPEEAEQQAKKELRRIEHMPEASSEYSMIRSYLDWLTELPWSIAPEDPIDISRAREILDEDHYGLEKIKRRILEHLAVRKLRPDGKSPILCFAGPPGVGKTSLGQSIARAMGRKFVRVSLGGLHDEAEIRGHRRTYIGALPGNIIQAIRKAGARNCVLMLDEIDKLGVGFHGDPSSALLEVLDPEQNSTFRDNYLGVPFDLSTVMFIATANVLDAIPGPLRDRMEVIELPGYTEDEKLQIAHRYLVARQLDAHGLSPQQCTITDDALRGVICDYTREAGCRNLDREIGALCRHAAMRIAEDADAQVVIAEDDLHTVLGPKRFENELAMRTSLPGVATGLAWTPVGGDILFVEATRIPGTGALILTGQLGDVMKESAQAALSLVKSRANALGISEEVFTKSDIHVHVPAGAIPKDGPSAGVTMYVTLVSLLTDKKVRSDTAMTGEISLRGLVLPVGGIKEKVVAAARSGIKTVLLPSRNKKDFEDIPEDARRQLKFVWLDTVDDAAAAIDQVSAAAN
jgi:ATP-dependent Lon protease